MSTKYFINPNLFFLVKEGKIICWNYKNHEQYELTKEHLTRLIDISNNKDSARINLDSELNEANLLSISQEGQYWGWDILSKIFHFGTQIPKESNEDGESAVTEGGFSLEYLKLSEALLNTAPPFYVEVEGEKVMLPPPDFSLLENYSLLSALQERKTCRDFNKNNIPLSTVSTLLSSVFGEIRTDKDEYNKYGYEQIGLRKSSPSGGGLHATEAYLVALHVEGLSSGIYHFEAHNRVLTLLKSVDVSEQLTDLFCGQYFAADLSLGVFLTSRFDKLWHKYPHSRAYRVALLDIGHVSQTFQLVATALKLNPWLTGAFIDEDVIELLQIQDSCEQPMFFVGAGLGQKSALDRMTKSLIAM